ncbi:MAG: 4Fe-4S dicluster domain-containing protein [bacterium]
MPLRVNPKLIEDLDFYGAEDVQYCYHCGDCSAVCVHADEIYRFPRKSMRSLQMGLERKLETGLEPWLCYYCGQCSSQCPREADPGETMMSLRRWLIGRYDFTGIARRFYISKTSEILAVVITGLLTGFGFFLYGYFFGNIRIYDGPGAFLPSPFIHTFDLTLGSLIGIILLINAWRMWRLTLYNERSIHIPWWLYLKRLYLPPLHFFTQKRYAECESIRSTPIFMPWIIHLFLMLGYVIMLVLVMAFIEQLQAGPEINWNVHIFGYASAIGLTIGTIYFLRSRLRKTAEVQYKKSHSTDWVFVILLMIIVLTGIIQHIFHRTGVPVAANIIYILHLMAVVPWLLRMPFTKWAHMVYRPLGMYFAGVRKDAILLQEKKGTLVPNLV